MESEDLRAKRLSYYYEQHHKIKPTMTQKSLDKLNIINKIFGYEYEPPKSLESSSKYHNFALSQEHPTPQLNEAGLLASQAQSSEIFSSFLNTNTNMATDHNDSTLVNDDPMTTSSHLDLDVPFKIQYNSAYNIYDPNANLIGANATSSAGQRNTAATAFSSQSSVNLFSTTNDVEQQQQRQRKKSVDFKKLSSTGSSLTPSPSSTTTADHHHQIKRLESFENNPSSSELLFGSTSTNSYHLAGYEARPPEKKPSFSSNNGHSSSSRYNNYRKNLYKINGSSNLDNSMTISQVHDHDDQEQQEQQDTGPYKLRIRRSKPLSKQSSQDSQSSSTYNNYHFNPVEDADHDGASHENLKKIYNEISKSLQLAQTTNGGDDEDAEVFQRSKSFLSRKNSTSSANFEEISAYHLNDQNVSDLKNNNMLQKQPLQAAPPSKFDLTIDLSAVNDDDERDSASTSDKHQQQLLSDYYYVNPEQDEESDSYENASNQQFMNNFNPRASIQIKPDNIPNLVLDMFDDDKSASVNASLAKSMCQEIDYKKEMEMITKTKKLSGGSFNKSKSIAGSSKYILDTDELMMDKKGGGAARKTSSSSLAPLQPNPVVSSVNPTSKSVFQHQSSFSIIDSSDGSARFSSASQITVKPGDIHRKSANFKATLPLSKSPTRAAQTTSAERKELARSKTLKLNKINLTRNRSSLLSSKIKSIALTSDSDKQAERIENFYADPQSNKFIDIHTKLDPINLLAATTTDPAAQTAKNKLEKSVIGIEATTSSKNSKPRRLKTSESLYINSSAKTPKINSKHSLIDHLSPPNSEMEPGVGEPESKGELFLSYSKFIAIENNFKNQQTADQTRLTDDLPPRPKSSHQKLAMVLNRVGVGEPDSDSVSKNVDLKTPPLESGVNSETSSAADLTATVNNNQLDETTLQVAGAEVSVVADFVQPTEPNDADWLSMPDEIWLKIISLLPHKDLIQFGRSCKAFSHLYTDHSLWRRISMKYKYEMCDEWLSWIGKRQPNELNIVQCSGNITLHAIADMFKNIGDNLRRLNLSRCSNGSLSGDNFALQASIRCPNVTELDLSWTLLSNQTLKLIADSFKKIESINLSGCSMIQEEGFNCLLLKHGEVLRDLDISSCIHFSSNAILNIGVYCQNLAKLNISLCHRITNESIMEATPHFTSLKHLELKGIKNVKTNCISMLVRKCPQLEALGLADCVHIGDAAILEVVTYKPNIKYLDLNGCKKISDQSLRSISTFCSNLESLSLKATSITDIGLMFLANSKCNRTLRELNLSYLPISDSVLTKILNSCSGIRSIQLYGCYNIKKIADLKKSHSSCKFHI